MGRKSKPYATMADGPDAYLFRKDGKQKLVGSADNEPEAGEEELAEDEDYQYRDEVDVEFDGNNSKIWHYGKAPGGDWETIDRSPYAQMDDFAWDLYVDFHKQNGRWPNQQESRKIEDLEYKVMTKMNEELNEIRALAGLPPVAEDCDETPGDNKNDDGDCSPFTHADENVDMVKEEDIEIIPDEELDYERCPECSGTGMGYGIEDDPCKVCKGSGIAEDVAKEDFLAPKKDAEDSYDTPEGEEDWNARAEPELDRQTDYNAPSRYDGDDSFDFDIDGDEYYGEDANTKVGREFASSEFGGPTGNTHVGRKFASGEIEEQGPGDDEFDADPDAMVDVGDDEDYEVYDFEDEFDAMMGNTTRFESVEEQVVAMNEIRKAAGLDPIAEGDEKWEEKECDSCHGAGCGACDDHGYVDQEIEEALEESDGDKCIRCRKGTMERGDTFFGPAERCNHCNYQRQLSESAPHDSGDYEFINFNDDKAYFLVADEIGDRIIFGMNNEVGIPEQYVDGMVALLKNHGFEAGNGYNFAGVDEDLQNGYGEHEYADSYDDYFPRGSHQSPSNDLGPTASGYGDNAMQNKMRSKETDRVYEGMRQKYRRYRLS
jgi:DnaJ-class molecular chaperone